MICDNDTNHNPCRRFAMLRIQRALRSGRALTAVSLYHAARAIWPTDGAFGTATMPLEDEMNEIKAILVTDLKEVRWCAILVKSLN